MPRRRDISPGFFTHEELYAAELSSGFPLRVAFAGLWCVADREGRFEWRNRIKLDVLPYDQVDFMAVLETLAVGGFIRRYQVGGKVFGFIPAWHDHQHPHPREAPSRLPEPPSDEGHAEAMPRHVQGTSKVGASPVRPSGLRAFKPSSPQAVSDEVPTAAAVFDAVREKIPAEYRSDYDGLVRSSHSPDTFRREVATLAAGKHPRAEGATPADVGQACRELALDGRGAGKIASFVGPITKRRREAGRTERAKAEVRENDKRKREENGPKRGGPLTPLNELLPALGIDRGVA